MIISSRIILYLPWPPFHKAISHLQVFLFDLWPTGCNQGRLCAQGCEIIHWSKMNSPVCNQSNTMTVLLKESITSQNFIKTNKPYKTLSIKDWQQVAPNLSRACPDKHCCSEFMIQWLRLLLGLYKVTCTTAQIPWATRAAWAAWALATLLSCFTLHKFHVYHNVEFYLNSKRFVCPLVGLYRCLIMW